LEIENLRRTAITQADQYDVRPPSSSSFVRYISAASVPPAISRTSLLSSPHSPAALITFPY